MIVKDAMWIPVYEALGYDTTERMKRSDRAAGIDEAVTLSELTTYAAGVRSHRIAQGLAPTLYGDEEEQAQSPGERELATVKAYQAQHPGMSLTEAYISLADVAPGNFRPGDVSDNSDAAKAARRYEKQRAAIDAYRQANPSVSWTHAYLAVAAANPELFKEDRGNPLLDVKPVK